MCIETAVGMYIYSIYIYSYKYTCTLCIYIYIYICMSIVYIYNIYLYIYIVHPQSHQDVQLVAGVTGVTGVTGVRTPMWLWFSRSTSQDSRLDVPVVFEFWILWGGGLGKSNMMIVIMIINCYYFIIVIDVLEYDDYDDFYQDHPFDFYLLELFFLTFWGCPSILSKLNTTTSEFDIFLKWSTAMGYCPTIIST